jgi:cadmium resistance protein CadD (predicted permease)
VAAFAATNIDGLFLTAALLSAAPGGAARVVAGTFLGIGALYAAGVALALAAAAIPGGYIALLGLVPLGLGLKLLLTKKPADEPAPAAQGLLAVAGINVAAGGDNIGVYTPLFATATGGEIVVYGVVFAVLTGVLCRAAHELVTHPALGAPVRRWGPRLVPWVLVALGLWILAGGL